MLIKEEIEMPILAVGSGWVRLSVRAPRSVTIRRGELK